MTCSWVLEGVAAAGPTPAYFQRRSLGCSRCPRRYILLSGTTCHRKEASRRTSPGSGMPYVRSFLAKLILIRPMQLINLTRLPDFDSSLFFGVLMRAYGSRDSDSCVAFMEAIPQTPIGQTFKLKFCQRYLSDFENKARQRPRTKPQARAQTRVSNASIMEQSLLASARPTNTSISSSSEVIASTPRLKGSDIALLLENSPGGSAQQSSLMKFHLITSFVALERTEGTDISPDTLQQLEQLQGQVESVFSEGTQLHMRRVLLAIINK
jgi:hypothetical protein